MRYQKLSMGHARALINVEDIDNSLPFQQSATEESKRPKVEGFVKALNEGAE